MVQKSVWGLHSEAETLNKLTLWCENNPLSFKGRVIGPSKSSEEALKPNSLKSIQIFADIKAKS